MEIFDFHAHIYPEKIASRAVEGVGEFYKIGMTCDGTAESLIKDGESAGITHFLVHSVATTTHHVPVINNFIVSECEKHPQFFGFGTMHQDFEEKEAEVERISEMGLHGIKIHPDTQEFNIDDERMFPLYDILQSKNMPVLIHCGDYRYDFSHPRRVRKILHEFPKLTVIGAHFGGWSVWDLALEYLRNERCMVDVSSSLMMCGLERGKELIRIYGKERVLFGSDFPMWSPSHELEQFLKMGLTDEENEYILCKNAKRLLGLEK